MDATVKNWGEIEKKDIVIVDFWAPWCGPCLALAPLIEEVAKETKVDLVKCNIGDFPELAEKYNISSIPTVLVFKKGIINGEVIGVRPKKVYLEALN